MNQKQKTKFRAQNVIDLDRRKQIEEKKYEHKLRQIEQRIEKEARLRKEEKKLNSEAHQGKMQRKKEIIKKERDQLE